MTEPWVDMLAQWPALAGAVGPLAAVLKGAASTLQVAAPLLLAALAAVVGGRAGQFDLGLVGKVLLGVLVASALARAGWGLAWILGAVAAVGAALGAMQAQAVDRFGARPLALGIGLSMLAAATVVLSQPAGVAAAGDWAWAARVSDSAASVPGDDRSSWPSWRLAGGWSPVASFTLLAWCAALGVGAGLGGTRFGLHLQVAGAHHTVAGAAGIRVDRVKAVGMALGSVLAAWAGVGLWLIAPAAVAWGFPLGGGVGVLALGLAVLARWRVGLLMALVAVFAAAQVGLATLWPAGASVADMPMGSPWRWDTASLGVLVFGGAPPPAGLAQAAASTLPVLSLLVLLAVFGAGPRAGAGGSVPQATGGPPVDAWR